ncbi:hypothetical protein STPL106120_00260 [Streptococcus pluranimalium]
MISIKNYEPKHEKSWVYCKALAYLFQIFGMIIVAKKMIFPTIMKIVLN